MEASLWYQSWLAGPPPQYINRTWGLTVIPLSELVYAWARENKGFTTGIKSLGEHDFIAPAVKKGNDDLKGWIDDEITKLTKEGFFEKDYKKTLLPVYGKTVEADTVIMNEKELKEYK